MEKIDTDSETAKLKNLGETLNRDVAPLKRANVSDVYIMCHSGWIKRVRACLFVRIFSQNIHINTFFLFHRVID